MPVQLLLNCSSLGKGLGDLSPYLSQSSLGNPVSLQEQCLDALGQCGSQVARIPRDSSASYSLPVLHAMVS